LSKKPSVDKLLLISIFCLVLYGTIMIFSASPVMGIKVGDEFYYLKRHFFYLFLGFGAFIFGQRLDIQKLKKATFPLMSISILFLMMLFIPGVGKTLGGATRWLDFKFISFQPSELVKLSVILFVALRLSTIKEGIKDFVKGLLPILLVLGIISGIIIKQPDLGTALSIMGTSFLMLFLGGAEMLHLGLLFLSGAAGVLVISIFSSYRLKRLLAYLDPWKDPLGTGFHIIQSLIAVGSGGVFGLGIGNSRQKFYYLPQQYADFIFAVICEELGLIGAIVLISLFLLFFIRGAIIAANTKDLFMKNLAFGIVSMFFIQTILNLMVVVAIIPTTGIPLPFVSYGGTAIIINFFAVGILSNISRLKE